eukprot:TRINITY_DN8722_c0_g1_i1.p1 TRINITY_DN8722_c0_g1~~TRINITY_DN8722_c0_g1_i1.p1  ORF type:complete len:402 (+),score=48.05 TRINITY_DN8722_c0_g1_i1:42-1247(+)
MPMYEGIGLISEKHAVVLDIGHAYTKCGYAGEINPRCIIRSEVEPGKSLHSINKKDELYNALVEFIHRLYFKCLLVNPKDRRVVIIESVLGSSLFKETLARVLFRHYEVSSVLFAPSHLLPLFTLGIRTALVLDVGHSEACLIPIYEGVPILKSWQAQPLAGSTLQESVRVHLLERGQLLRGSGGDESPTPLAHSPEILTPNILEDITVRCCMVTSLNRGRELDRVTQDASQVTSLSTLLKNSAPSVRYSVGGDSYLEIDGITREGAAEVLFQMDTDGNCIGSMILNALQSCPIDTRRELASSLLIVGGTSMMPGFKSRLNQELLYLLSLPQYADIKITEFKLYQPPAAPNLVTWLGGAIFGATDVVVTRSLTREQYIKDPSVPDWSDLRYNSTVDDARQG